MKVKRLCWLAVVLTACLIGFVACSPATEVVSIIGSLFIRIRRRKLRASNPPTNNPPDL